VRGQVARSLGATPALFVVLSRLVAGTPALGSRPGWIANRLRAAGLQSGGRVIELACGRGELAHALASRSGASVLGIDASPAFVRAARQAERARLAAGPREREPRAGGGSRSRRSARGSGRCVFRVEDVRVTLRRGGAFDAALMIGLWGAERAVPALRRLTRPGGIYAFDDALARRRSPGGAMAVGDVRAMIEARGDRLLGLFVERADEVRRRHRAMHRRLVANASLMAEGHRALAPSLRAFLAHHARAGELLTGPLRPTLWIVRRAEDGVDPPADVPVEWVVHKMSPVWGGDWADTPVSP
jgi:SAM-dependent methyltransferase